ncbi:uncharacterized protein LOC143231548 [Tachypleus tridentatus]|uniref:uncharacterized protein LOC143231548 n=1 Tax=Tachypleus tridentatus TaxID=6853 RepID=UPI003FD0003F
MKSSMLRGTTFAVLFAVAVARPHGKVEVDTRFVVDQMMRTLLNRLFSEKNSCICRTSHQAKAISDVIKSDESTGDSLLHVRKSTGGLWHVSKGHQKRGSECMRKCILQGILHPVQCHSLC